MTTWSEDSCLICGEAIVYDRTIDDWHHEEPQDCEEPTPELDPRGVRERVEAGHDPGFYICEGPGCYRPAVARNGPDMCFCEVHLSDDDVRDLQGV